MYGTLAKQLIRGDVSDMGCPRYTLDRCTVFMGNDKGLIIRSCSTIMKRQ